MRVIFDYPYGQAGWQREVELPLVPREGESVFIDGDSLFVAHVEWYPYGDGEGEPFAYVVIKKP